MATARLGSGGHPLFQDKAFNAMVFGAAAWGAMLSDCPLDPSLECWVSPCRTSLPNGAVG